MMLTVIYVMARIGFWYGLDYVHKRIYDHFRRIESVYRVPGFSGYTPCAYYMTVVWA